MVRKSKLLALSLGFCISIFAFSPVSAQMQGGFQHNGELVMGQSNMRGGFHGPNSVRLVSVSQLRSLPDDSYAIIEGSIVRQIRGDHYEFRDTSGSIEVEIDNKYWAGNTITPNNTVRLLIEIDHDLLTSEYEVEAPIVVVR